MCDRIKFLQFFCIMEHDIAQFYPVALEVQVLEDHQDIDQGRGEGHEDGVDGQLGLAEEIDDERNAQGGHVGVAQAVHRGGGVGRGGYPPGHQQKNQKKVTHHRQDDKRHGAKRRYNRIFKSRNV